MKIGIITDIHSNSIALEKILRYFEKEGCEKIICCGDIIGIGPFPEETVQLVRGIKDLIAVRGNHEEYLLGELPDKYPNAEKLGEEEIRHHRWQHGQLSSSSEDFLKNLPLRADIWIEGMKVTALHYEEKAAEASIKDPIRIFGDTDSDVILFGHDHRRAVCFKGERCFFNPGSLGCPGRERDIARAGILCIEKGHVEAKPVDIRYNAQDVLKEIDRLNYPDAGTIKRYFYGAG